MVSHFSHSTKQSLHGLEHLARAGQRLFESRPLSTSQKRNLESQYKHASYNEHSAKKADAKEVTTTKENETETGTTKEKKNSSGTVLHQNSSLFNLRKKSSPVKPDKHSQTNKSNANAGILQTLTSLFGFTKSAQQSQLEARESRENAANPFIKYPVVTHEQMQQVSSNTFKLEVGHASFAHHSSSTSPTIHSLSDLTDPTQLNSLLPRRRPQGSPADTLSIKAGDDAMLISPTLLAVADGVSGWGDKERREKGMEERGKGMEDSGNGQKQKAQNTSSGVWARSMLETLSRLLTEYRLSHMPHALNSRDVQQVLDDSFLHTSHLMDLQGLSGSSTLVLGMLSGDTLKYISIGDSRLWVVRNDKVVFTNPGSTDQEIDTLCPQQIGTQTLGQLPSAIAEVGEVLLQENDVVCLCSDGVSDNLFDWEIEEMLVSFSGGKNRNLKAECARMLAKCKEVAYDDNAYTPYNEKVNQSMALSRGRAAILGGKMDDMSLCIARVVYNT